MQKLEGRCLCQNISYSGDTEILMTVLCSCKNCQRASGSASTVNIVIQKSGIEIQGELTRYEDTGDSGQPVNRYFCNQCGSAIYSEAETIPGLTILKVGTLDDTTWVKPTMEMYCSSAQTWVELNEDIQKFPKMMSS